MNINALNASAVLFAGAILSSHNTAAGVDNANTGENRPADNRRLENTAAIPLNDSDFVQRAALTSNAEIELSQLALQTSKNGQVRYFAEKMVQDHSQSVRELKAIASRKGYNLPTGVDEAHRKQIDALARFPNAQFDVAYMDQMLADHEQALALFRQQTQTGVDDGLRQYAIRTVPHLQEHLRMAREIRQKL